MIRIIFGKIQPGSRFRSCWFARSFPFAELCYCDFFRGNLSGNRSIRDWGTSGNRKCYRLPETNDSSADAGSVLNSISRHWELVFNEPRTKLMADEPVHGRSIASRIKTNQLSGRDAVFTGRRKALCGNSFASERTAARGDFLEDDRRRRSFFSRSFSCLTVFMAERSNSGW